MLVAALSEKFNRNEPIFTNEILDCFQDYSRAYVFRLIKKAVEKQELVYFDSGVYYLPTQSSIGLSTITAEDVAKKRYIGDGKEVYGIYSGLNLQNIFSLTTQMPNVLEIVTNRETTRCRQVEIDGRRFVLRRSRCMINKENIDAYKILQLFSEIAPDVCIKQQVRSALCSYMKEKKVGLNDIVSLANVFPAKAMKNLILSGVFNEFTQG